MDTRDVAFGIGAFDTPPVIMSLVPNIGDTDVTINTTIQATFDQNIAIGSGNIEIWDRLDSTLVETVDVTTDVTVVGNTLSFTPGSLQIATEYTVLIPENAIMSLTGKTFAAIAALSAWTFTTQAQSSLSISVPSDNESIDEGTLQDVEYTYAGYTTTDVVEISVSYDGGFNYNLLTSGTIDDLFNNNYKWNTDSPDSTGAWLKVENITNAIGGYRDSVHVTIVPYISFPYEIYDYVVGDYVYFDFDRNSNVSSSDKIEISVSYDGGLSYTVLETDLPFTDFGVEGYSYSFIAEGPVTSQARIKIEDLSTPHVIESHTFSIFPPLIEIYENDGTVCGGTDGSFDISGLTYDQEYSIYYTQDGVDIGPIIQIADEGTSILGLPKGVYSNFYVEYNGIQSNIVSGPLYIDDGSPRTYLTGTDNTTCSPANGSIYVVDSVAYSSADFELYAGTDTTATALDIQSDYGFWTFSGLSGGTYTVVTRYIGGGTCVDAQTITISDTPDSPIINSGLATLSNPTNVGGMDGSIDITGAISGGSGEYNVSWYTGTDTTANSLFIGNTLTGVPAGTYTVVAEDGGGTGCIGEVVTFTLVDPAVLSGLVPNYVASTSAQVQLSSTEVADISFVVTTSSISPSATRISNGQDENGNPAYGAYTYIDNPSGVSTIEVGTGFETDRQFAPETTYYIYLVADNGNFSDIVSTSFTTTASPSISTVSPTIGDVGTTVTITGANFLASGNKVFLGENEVSVDSESATEISFIVPANSSSYAQVKVLAGRAYAGSSYFNTTHLGGFITSSSYASNQYDTNYSWDVAMGDLNGDGLMDRVRIEGNASNVVVELRNATNDGYETGIFYVIPSGTNYVEVADMNADGYPDIITSRSSSSGVFPVRVNYNDGNGMFNQSFEALGDVNGTSVTSLTIGDLNNDGLNDVLVTTNTTSPASVIYKRADSAYYEAPQALPVAGETGRNATIADFNNDGLNDIAVTILNSDQVAVYLRNVSNTGFENPSLITLATGAAPQAISSGDFDKDGNLDIVSGASNSATTTSVYYLAGNGDGTFQASLALEAGAKDLRTMVTGDLNGDANLDIITGSYFNDDLRIFTGNGDGTFGNVVEVTLNGVQSIALADINGDGADDIHVGTGNNTGVELTFSAQVPDVEFSAVSVPSADLYQGSSDNLVFATSFTVTGSPVSFDGMYFNVDGNYNVADFPTDGFELWYNIGTNDFATATSAGTTSLGVLSDTTVGWSFTETFADGATVYLYASASIAADATTSGTFNIGLDVNDPVESFGIADPKNKFTSNLVDGNIFTIISSDTIPPTVVGDTLVSIDENATLVNTYAAGETVTWALSGTDAASFDISVDGELTLLVAPDFESPADANADNRYELVLEASDSLANTVSYILEVTVLDLNDNAPEILDPGAVSIDENSLLGSLIVDCEFTDADTTVATNTWSIISGNIDVNGNTLLPLGIDETGAIAVNDSADIDFELVTQFSIEVRLSDGINADTIALTILVNDVKEGQDPETEADSLALLSIYDALAGADWVTVNWKESLPLTEWTGVTMTDTRVTALDLSSNNLKGDFPVISSGLEALTSLNLKDNEITSVLDLSSMVALSTADVSDNKLGFASLEALFFGEASVTISPQKAVLARVRTLEEIGSTYTVDRTVSGSANTYSWTKNGEALAQTGASFDVSIENFSADGIYVAKVTSGVIPLVELITQPVVLRVSSLERDSAALMAVYDALDGSSSELSDWMNTSILEWPEVAFTGSRVTGLNAANMNLSGALPEDIFDVKGLTSIDLSGNNIDGLPDLTGYLPNLTSFNVSGNKLTFEDLESNTGVSGIDYSDQQPVGTPLTEVVPEGTEYTLSVPVGGTANSYEWTLMSPIDTAVLSSEITSSLIISAISYETMGTYTMQVTNELVPGLILSSEPQEVLASANFSMIALDQGDEAFTTAQAVALKINPLGQKYDTIQVLSETSAGAFVFENLILDNYVIAVAPDNNNEFLISYFESTDQWKLADTLKLRRDSAETLSMVGDPGSKGQGGATGASISGTVEEDDGTGSRITARRKVKRAGCSVRRFVPKGRTDQEDGEFVLYAYVESDEEGQFEFTELEDGLYRFNIEYPGIPMDEHSYVEFTIGEGGIEDEVLILQATVTEDGIVVEKIERLGFYRKYFKDLNVYPNPADNLLYISYGKLISANVTVRLIDLEGNVVKEQEIEKGDDKALNFDVSAISGGIYLLNFVDTSLGAEKITTFKVFVKH